MWLPLGVNEAGPPTATTAVDQSSNGGDPATDRARLRPGDRSVAPLALPSFDTPDLPETLRYRLKNTLLGPPLASERQSTERLGKPTALAVLSSDVISSSAYATEQILLNLIKVIGVAAFSLVIGISAAVIVVLFFVTLSYLEVVKVYTKAGGAYVVARENFGPKVAQIAAVSLLIDYTLTVAVSVAAGVAALTSVFGGLTRWTVEIAIGFVVIIAYGNLRGIREAGRLFAIPTYFFIVNMVLLIGVGIAKDALGQLHPLSLHQKGAIHIGTPGGGLLLGASLFVVMKAFAAGGSALTGTEAISNGVSVFRQPEARNARITLVIMGLILGSLVMGVAFLASVVHPVPRILGTPTVVAQIAKYVYGPGALAHVLFIALQAGTMLILVLAANTSFTGFPFLASFAAADSYLPRALTRRGHRLVFSTGIIVLTVVSVILLVVTRARVDSLIPLYAIGVFTGFTIAGAGMVKYHLTHREPQWQRRAVINGTAGVLSFIVDIIIAVTKFNAGGLGRPHPAASRGAAAPAAAPPVRGRGQATGTGRRAWPARSRCCAAMWCSSSSTAWTWPRRAPSSTPAPSRPTSCGRCTSSSTPWRPGISKPTGAVSGLGRLPLDIIECPDRRLARAALELAAQTTADGTTELTILLPAARLRGGVAASAARPQRRPDRRRRGPTAARERHHRPLPVDARSGGTTGTPDHRDGRAAHAPAPPATFQRMEQELGPRAEGTTPIAEVTWRARVRVAGRVKSIRVPTRTPTPSLECTLVDGTGALLLVFQGRRKIPGIQQGARLVAQGTVGAWEGRLAILNPDYELIAGPDTEEVDLRT